MVDLPRRIVLSAVLGGLMLLGGGLRAGEPGEGKDPAKLWSEGVDLFERGELSRAREKFDAVLELTDENVAAKLVQRCGLPAMIRLLSSGDALGRSPKVIWELYSKYNRKRLVDAKLIQEQVDKAIGEKTPEVQRQAALHQLRRIGQYAVPELAKHLGDKSPDQRALVRIALSYIGTRGTLAMVKLLETGDDHFKETLALALSDIKPADTRAVPALKRLYDDPKCGPTLKEKLAYALTKITGLSAADMAPYQDYYYLLADRYYTEQTAVPEEALEYDGAVWELKDGALVYRRVPIYAWNEEIAEDLVHECLKHSPEYDRIVPLMVLVQLAQREEVEAIRDAMKISGRPPTMTDADEKLLLDRGKLLVDTQLLAQACGPRYIYRAVGKALRDSRFTDCAAAIDLLPLVDPDGSMLPPVPAPVVETGKTGRAKAPAAEPEKKPAKKARKGAAEEPVPEVKGVGGGAAELVTSAEARPVNEGQPLVDALDCKDDGVRFSAAIALARMAPAVPFPGADKVVAALADAVSKSGPLQILVVEEEDDPFKELEPRLTELNHGVTRATSGRDALGKATGFPPKDLILVASNIKADLSAKGEKEGDEGLLERLAKDRAASLVPVAILVKKEDLAAEQARFGLRSYITRDLKGQDLKDELLKALGKTGPGVTKQKREAMAARAAGALLEIDPRRTQFLPADSFEACQNALFNRPDEVRNPCIRALGLFRVQPAAADLLRLFDDKRNTVELRGNCLYALGQSDPAAAKDAFLKAQADEKEFVLRDGAAVGFGKYQASPDVKALTDFLQKCRLVRTAEGGDGRPAIHKGGEAPAGAPAAPAATPAPAAAPAGE